MRRNAFLSFERGAGGIPLREWQAFCVDHDIKHTPHIGNGNIFYHGDVEIAYAWRDETVKRGRALPPRAYSLSFSTSEDGTALGRVAKLACFAWRRWGGTVTAAPEVTAFFMTTSHAYLDSYQAPPYTGHIALAHERQHQRRCTQWNEEGKGAEHGS